MKTLFGVHALACGALLQSDSANSLTGGDKFSLSLGERAGVRGGFLPEAPR